MWQPYKEILEKYKQAIFKAIKEFVSSILRVHRHCKNRILKILAKEHTNPSLLNRTDGSGTMLAKESLEILVNTHFTGNTPTENKPPVVKTIHKSGGNMELITKERLLWEINIKEAASYGCYNSRMAS